MGSDQDAGRSLCFGLFGALLSLDVSQEMLRDRDLPRRLKLHNMACQLPAKPLRLYQRFDVRRGLRPFAKRHQRFVIALLIRSHANVREHAFAFQRACCRRNVGDRDNRKPMNLTVQAVIDTAVKRVIAKRIVGSSLPEFFDNALFQGRDFPPVFSAVLCGNSSSDAH
ncbi:MAG: hypothetical protein Q8R02_17040 [Hyphomonadaceae bacterium]|nr:hypothetical protein [Hyphomonadaceae bacterium]